MKSWTDILDRQPIATKMLRRMLIRGRIAHAYLIQGDPGTGKEAFGYLLAKSLFCKEINEGEPCHQCNECRRIDSGNHPDVHWIRPDGASIKKDQIAHLQKEFTYTGLESNQKVYLISHADLMTTNAANRLLKFLEEPSQKTTAILMTENSQAILDTVKSRCQTITLMPLSSQSIQEALQEEGILPENARLFSVVMPNLEQARALDQDEWFAQARKLVVQLVEILQSKPDETLLFIQKQWMEHFSDREKLSFGLGLLMYWFKDLIYLQIDQKEAIVFQSYLKELEKCVWHWSKNETTQILAFILEAKRHIMQNVHPTLVMEKLTLRMQR
ncbi:DNA polymerase III subunit delta' [Amphibacillus sp. Q70]|uniref:DNA polymerase III subunit delta' n=1 Tax=Amphibacillus sp. Q70 TaxID=3453416 RepID=UPI003F853733